MRLWGKKRFNPKLLALRLMAEVGFHRLNPGQRIAYANLETTTVSDLVLLCDLDFTVQQVLDYADRYKKAGKTWLARYGNRWVTLFCPGGGAQSFEFAITALAHAGAKKIIQIGVCGSLSEKIGIGDLVVAESVHINDDTARAHTSKTIIECRNEMYTFANTVARKAVPPEIPLHFCRVVSGHTLFGQTKEMLREWAKLAPIVDLETGVLFALTEKHQIECLAIYAVVDDKLRDADIFQMSEFPMSRIFDNSEVLLSALVKGIRDFNFGLPERGKPA